MTELDAAVADLSKPAEWDRIDRAARLFYTAIKVHGVKQADLVRKYGLTRETIRRYVEDETIRRGEMKPTERYLKAQERRVRAEAGS